MRKLVILTAIGSDRPGLTQALAEAIATAGGNWLESHLTRLGGKYVGSVLVEIPGDRLAALEAAVRGVDATGLQVSLADAGEDGPAAGEVLLLELVGQDRPGIVREVTAVLSRLRVNIENLATGTENSSMSGARLFKAQARLTLPASVSEEQLREALEHISGEIMVDFTFSPAAI
jgi:glycine cleavage system regulatory protein